MRRCLTGLLLAALLAVPFSLAQGQGKKPKGLWTDPEDPTLPIDIHLQGEYVGTFAGGDKVACQVIALGDGAFQAVLLPGGLPGAGWDGRSKSLLAGKLDGKQAIFEPARGKRKYLGRKPEEFSATSKYPPPGHVDCTATLSAGKLMGKTADGKEFSLTKTTRVSPTMGDKCPRLGIVLFDGTDTKAWTRGRLDPKTKLLNTDGGDIRTKQKFNDYTMHVEFLLPYRPLARGQERGNSGFYQVDMYEVQILDSFGLDGKNNECGGIYSQRDPLINMCLPPLVWQTYDVDFTNAVRDKETGKKVRNSRLTVRLNGVVIHDNVELTGPTGGARSEPEGTPGPLQLQGHGNPLQFRNVWIVEKK